VAGRALKESEHIVSKFQDLEASFLPEASLRYSDLSGKPRILVNPQVDMTRNEDNSCLFIGLHQVSSKYYESANSDVILN
jgi:hypothetical protein